MKIEKLPFYFQSNIDNNNAGYPIDFPFHLYYDTELKMYRQKDTPELSSLLEKVYIKGSLVDGSLSSNTGANYIEEILKIIATYYNSSIEAVLEIGGGTGDLLQKIDAKFKTIVEPGEHINSNYDLGTNIEIIKDFFPTKKLSTLFDLIIHFAVLEHIADPIKFLSEQKKILKKHGRIIFGVPNEEPYIDSGDIGMLIHEHYNYFTTESLFKTVEKAGLFIEKYFHIEGMIILIITTKPQTLLEYPVFDSDLFLVKMIEMQRKMELFLNKYENKNIALYAPSRAINTLFFANGKNVRLVDDNPEVHNKYLPFLNNSIENFADIVNEPPSVILIFSRTFGNRIKEKCQKQKELQDIGVFTLNDL